MANQLFTLLKNGLRRADNQRPNNSALVIGFTKKQMARMDLKKPRLVWYDHGTNSFFDQGDSTVIKKKDWMKINGMNYKKTNPISDLQYYIPLNTQMIEESDKPLD